MSNIKVAQDFLDDTFGENEFIVFTSIGCDGIEVHDAQGDFVEWFDNQADLERGMK
jgi:hypothetical protein